MKLINVLKQNKSNQIQIFSCHFSSLAPVSRDPSYIILVCLICLFGAQNK